MVPLKKGDSNYTNATKVCNRATQAIEEEILRNGDAACSGENINCHRHWAFAEFKLGNITSAIKQIKKAIEKGPDDAENWVVWGLIMRSVGNY